MEIRGPRNKVVAQIHYSLGPASNSKKYFVHTSETLPGSSISLQNVEIGKGDEYHGIYSYVPF